jgi:hypothetical protein
MKLYLLIAFSIFGFSAFGQVNYTNVDSSIKDTITSRTTFANEDGVVILANQVFSTNTFVNSTNGIFAIPSAGTWRLRYDISTDGTGANTNSQFQIVNGSGTLQSGTERTRGGSVTTSQSLTAEVVVTTSGAATYRIQGRNGGSGSATILNTAQNTSTISWKKESNFTPYLFNLLDQSSFTSTSGYFDIGTMRMQWGLSDDGNVDTFTVTLRASFGNTNYTVVVTSNNGIAGSTSVEAKTASTFDIDRASTTASANTWGWIAFGKKP